MRRFLTSILAVLVSSVAAGDIWRVPLGGNAYVTAGAGKDRVGKDGIRMESPDTVVSVFFHVDRPGELGLALRLRVPEGRSAIEARIAGAKFEAEAEGGEVHEVPLGKVTVKEAGYQRLDLRGIRKSGTVFAEVSEVVVTPADAGAKASFVRTNEGGMFYWGRRGPSVHLGYALPKDKTIEYAYSELTVPAGADPAGSYFMANGFGEGYFGIQVKSATERWVLFSVWSPHRTDRPADIPLEKRVTVLKKGEGVRANDFGGEGSGGQSVLVFPWQAGVTYRFLTSVKPDGKGATVYSSWFGEVGKGDWRLIASFRRPETNTHLTGFHSFLENFYDSNGYQQREALHGNQWVRDTGGTWHRITAARFTGDATAAGGHRLDYAGGVAKDRFFLRNGGYFNDRVPLNRRLELPPGTGKAPEIDFDKLIGTGRGG
jgi:hypothetical protein